MKQKIRKIVVDGQTYIWRFAVGYQKIGAPIESSRCHDVFTAWFPGNRAAFLRIHFSTAANPYTGGPLRDDPTNLHTPKWAALIIRQARQHGWNPAESTKAFVIENGVDFLQGIVSEVEI